MPYKIPALKNKEEYFMKTCIKYIIFLSFFYLTPSLSAQDKFIYKGITYMNINTATATFAGGCFWCMEPPFEKLGGVISVKSGYTGGNQKNPSYEEVSSGTSGHLEAIQIVYNKDLINYKTLLKVFFQNIDPTDAGGSFVDRGSQYASAVFYHDENQKQSALEIIKELDSLKIYKKKIATKVILYKQFYDAEDYHQDYYKKNPIRYKFYRSRSGRDEFINKFKSNDFFEITYKNFEKPSLEQLKSMLTPLQFEVTQNSETEHPFKNLYFDNKAKGIYVDIVSGQPLFSSTDKFDSKTGWPSFTKPIEPGAVIEKKDTKLFVERIEVRSSIADSHLGHVFKDGPKPTNLRYCINSASLKFIAYENLLENGFGRFMHLFEP